MDYDQRKIERRAAAMVTYGSLAIALCLGYGALFLQGSHALIASVMIPGCVLFAMVSGSAKTEYQLLVARESE